MVPFYLYVSSLKQPDSPEGDFIRDFINDYKGSLLSPMSWDALEIYLRSRHACPEAIKAARNVWKKYERKLRKLA